MASREGARRRAGRPSARRRGSPPTLDSPGPRSRPCGRHPRARGEALGFPPGLPREEPGGEAEGAARGGGGPAGGGGGRGRGGGGGGGGEGGGRGGRQEGDNQVGILAPTDRERLCLDQRVTPLDDQRVVARAEGDRLTQVLDLDLVAI